MKSKVWRAPTGNTGPNFNFIGLQNPIKTKAMFCNELFHRQTVLQISFIYCCLFKFFNLSVSQDSLLCFLYYEL